jgi:hypothetical protein
MRLMKLVRNMRLATPDLSFMSSRPKTEEFKLASWEVGRGAVKTFGCRIVTRFSLFVEKVPSTYRVCSSTIPVSTKPR